jgi:L-2,4-diaminobutyric acid acetyltransferase
MSKNSDTPRTIAPRLRKPDARDGAAIWALVKSCKPLDENSMYCNLVQVDHFRDTCVVAEVDGEVVGWISGHIIPKKNELFVWQVAVSSKARGLGLGRKMLLALIENDACSDVTLLKTTITKDNDASWALFNSFAGVIGGALEDTPHFERDAHFKGRHETEHLVTITLPVSDKLARAA